MVSFFEASMSRLSIHRVGNKSQNEFYALSKSPLKIEDEFLNNLLLQFFLGSFEKVNEVYHFTHPGDDLALNEMFHYSDTAFTEPGAFHDISEKITKYLFDLSDHPRIKSGELYIAYFTNVQLEGELLDAVGIFKSETKETYLKVYPDTGGFNVEYEQEGINIQKLDKGCLVFNSAKEAGFKVLVLDKTNTNDAVYWKDDFLKIKVRNDNFHKTNTTLSVYKNFVTEKLDDEFELTKADKIDLLNRSMKYFKEKETFDINEFSDEVIGNEKAAESFKNYTKAYEQEFETELSDSFDISGAAVKKQARVFKSVLKLDKNFHIYIHGNKELIEKGFDDEKAMNFYKVYFKEEV
ncbi:nucleoid-associated protein [Flavihumibacter sp. R14]|nr:nucleoid-associated protein [Flavihumibacter soli]